MRALRKSKSMWSSPQNSTPALLRLPTPLVCLVLPSRTHPSCNHRRLCVLLSPSLCSSLLSLSIYLSLSLTSLTLFLSLSVHPHYTRLLCHILSFSTPLLSLSLYFSLSISLSYSLTCSLSHASTCTRVHYITYTRSVLS